MADAERAFARYALKHIQSPDELGEAWETVLRKRATLRLAGLEVTVLALPAVECSRRYAVPPADFGNGGTALGLPDDADDE